nr:uncharacterized protein LOC117864765 [Setaria viridis]
MRRRPAEPQSPPWRGAKSRGRVASEDEAGDEGAEGVRADGAEVDEGSEGVGVRRAVARRWRRGALQNARECARGEAGGRRQPARCCLLPAASRCTSSASIVDGHTHLRCCGSGAVAVGYTRAATSCTKPPPPSTGGAAEAASLATAAMAKNASGARDEAGGKEEGVAAWPRGLPRHSQSSD